MKKAKRYLLLFFVLASVCTTKAYAEPELVKIGAIVPLTGGLALRGDDISKLLTILAPRFNASSRKYRYEFIVEDGRCGAGNATTSAAMKLINVDHVKFLITGCSGETLQAGPIAERAKVVDFAVLSLHPDVKKLGEYVFRTYIDIEGSMRGFAEYLGKESGRKVALLTEQNAFTFGMRDLLLRDLGAQVVFADDFPPDSVDFSTLLAKANAKGAKGIYLNVMSESTLAHMVNQIKRMGLTQRLFSYNMPEASSFRDATGKNSDNLEFIGAPDITNSSADFQDVLREYRKRHPEGPSLEFLLRTSYDAAKAIVDGVEAVGPDPTQVKIYLNGYSTIGALGKVEFDELGDIKHLHYVLRRLTSNGESEFITDLVQLP